MCKLRAHLSSKTWLDLKSAKVLIYFLLTFSLLSTNLMVLPSLGLDLVSKELEANANIPESLNSKVQDLSSSPFSRQETARMLSQRAHSECKWINQWINLATVSKGEICWRRDYWNSSGSCSMQIQRWCLLTQEEAIRSYETKGGSLHKPFTMVRPRIKLVFGSLTITALRLSNWGERGEDTRGKDLKTCRKRLKEKHTPREIFESICTVWYYTVYCYILMLFYFFMLFSGFAGGFSPHSVNIRIW